MLLTALQARLYCFNIHCCSAHFLAVVTAIAVLLVVKFVKFIDLHLAESVLCVYIMHISRFCLFNFNFTVMTSYIHTSGCHQLRLLSVYYL